VRETAERINDEREKNAKYQEILVNENQSLSKQILAITEMFSKKVEEFDALKEALAAKEQELNQARVEVADLRDYRLKYDRAAAQNQELNQKCALLNELVETQAKDHQARVKEITESKNQLAQENRQVRQQLNDALGQISHLKESLDLTCSKLHTKESELDVEKSKVVNLQGLKELNQRLQNEARQAKQERDQLHAAIDEILNENQEISNRMQEEFQRIAGERDSLNEELHELFAEKAEKDVVIKNLTSENLELNGRVLALEQLLCAKEDQDAQLDMLKEALQRLGQSKDKYKSDLEVCTNYLLEVEEKCQEAQKTSLELLQQLKLKEEEIESLHQVIQQLQHNATVPNVFVYHPVKDDPVDKRLAEYINNAPFKLRDQMRFEREAEGVYKYGKKRVFMKIEKDQIIIRVGGGYLTIEEFIEQYCDCETSKKKLFGLIYQG